MTKIYITGEINEESFRAFSEELDELETTLSRHEIIDIVLNSNGGCAVDGLAFYSRIKESPLDISVSVYGACWSAATMLLAAADRRRMAREAWVMVHEDSSTLKDTTTKNFEKEAHQMRRFENQWNALMAENSEMSAEYWAELHKEGVYLTADECMKLGLVDEVF